MAEITYRLNTGFTYHCSVPGSRMCTSRTGHSMFRTTAAATLPRRTRTSPVRIIRILARFSGRRSAISSLAGESGQLVR